MVDTGNPKELIGIASTRHDMRALPTGVRRNFGLALWAVQTGEMPPSAKPLRGFGSAGVLELIEDDEGGTLSRRLYRALCDGGLCAACVSEEVKAR
jgi:phage-related protein